MPNTNVMVAHNAAFDVDMLKKEGIELKSVICTLKLARYFDKDGVIPMYGLQYLRYYLKLKVNATPLTAWGKSWSLWRCSIGFSLKRPRSSGMTLLSR